MSLNEADTRAQLIDPALQDRGWRADMVRREQTAGKIERVNGVTRRSANKRADYTLRIPVADALELVTVGVIEAKAERHPANYGLDQAKLYASASRLNVPFVYSSNGHQFVEFDASTRLTSKVHSMSEFPTPAELRRRYETYLGVDLESPVARALLTPYPDGIDSVRYYQDAAIRAVFEKVAQGKKRVLLSLATGTGKTFIAVNLLRRISDAGQLRRALFVCDRDELRSQGYSALHRVFSNDVAVASTNNPEKNARVIVATYQTLGIGSDDDIDASYLKTHYPEDYFSHIVIDECHRSAWGKWSEVLTRNPDAVQIGLTATPREFDYTEASPAASEDQQITRDNLKYFGEPVYEYSIGQGMEDGYLALMQVVSRDIFLAGNVDHERDVGIGKSDLERGTITIADSGEAASISDVREQYGAPSLEKRLLMPDRVSAMCEDLFNHLASSDKPEQKTIIFCVDIRHANEVAAELNNLYVKWCDDRGRKKLPNYAFGCTAESGRDDIATFRDARNRFFIATTVDLLSTGVDIPALENVVFFRYLSSPIVFHQMIGRGTRIDERKGKLSFTVYDYTNATRLFGKELKTRYVEPNGDAVCEDPVVEGGRPPEERYEVEGIQVRISDAGTFIVVTNDAGQMESIALEDYKQMVRSALRGQNLTFDQFRDAWIDASSRRDVLKNLPDAGKSAYVVRRVNGMEEYDLYDVLGNIGYDLPPQTMSGRAASFSSVNSEWLGGMLESTRNTVLAVVSQFAKGGTDNLEDTSIFQTPEVRQAGGIVALSDYPEGDASVALQDTKRRIFTG